MTDTAARIASDADIEIARPNPNIYLAGNMAPVEHEVTAYDLPVTGEIPIELEGRWLRNGPNPFDTLDGPPQHWFVGAGMVHGVRLRGGKAEWYRNRYVLPGGRGPNTNVGGFAGTTWAMVEAGSPPVEMSYELESLGVNRFHDTLTGPFTRPPEVRPGDRRTPCHGVPLARPRRPRALRRRRSRRAGDEDARHPRARHADDARHVAHPDLRRRVRPAGHRELRRRDGGESFPFAWQHDRPARVGLVPRDGTADQIIWCDVDPCYVFHPLNAFDADDGTVVVDLCRYDTMMVSDRLGPFGDSLPTLDRWVIDPVARRVTETRIDDRPQEFPRHDPRVGLHRHRYGYTSEVRYDGVNLHGATLKVDVDTGTTQAHEYGRGRGGAEPVFVPKADGTAEDAGWILSVVYDATTDSERAVHPRRRGHHRPGSRPHPPPATRAVRIPRQLGERSIGRPAGPTSRPGPASMH